jgi:hypothetical protein
MFGRTCVSAALALILGGCAIHPLPEDVTGVSTYYIVRQIRCETRQAIIETALDWLTDDANQANGDVDPASRAIGFEFKNGRPIEQFNPKLFKGQVGKIVSVFYDAGVAYTFDLNMTETNNLDPMADLLRPLPRSKFTMNISGKFDRMRQNERLLTVTDSFSELIRMPKGYCLDPNTGRNFVVPENYIYPIAGKIGVKPMIQDFIVLTLFGALGGQAGDNQAAPPKGPPTLVDQLEFTTTISGTVDPTITFTPVGTALQVMDASLSANVEREDQHKVTVGLAIGGSGANLVGSVRNSLFALPLVNTHPTASSGEQNAAAAVNQFLTLKLFQPTVVVTP